MQIPGLEFNWGVYPEVQFHTVVPLTLDSPSGGSNQYGPGDIEVGIKHRFVDESRYLPQIGIFPMIELPSGNEDRGLGNGKARERLPLWIQKSWGPWTTYGGGGYAINPAPEQRNYGFGGWLLQRDIGELLTLGGELFLQGATSDGGAINRHPRSRRILQVHPGLQPPFLRRKQRVRGESYGGIPGSLLDMGTSGTAMKGYVLNMEASS